MSREEAGGGNRDILLQSKSNIDLRTNGPETTTTTTKKTKTKNIKCMFN